MYCAPNPSLRQHMVSVGSRAESTGQDFCGALVLEAHGSQPLHLRKLHLTVHGRSCLKHHLLHCGTSRSTDARLCILKFKLF